MNPNLQLIYPMFALVVLTFIVTVVMGARRKQAVTSGFDIRYFKTYNHGQPPDHMLRVDRHYTNLFEMPVLFYAGCIVAMIVPLSGFWIGFWTWGFVVARTLHAFIHIKYNKLPPRMLAFFTGVVMVLGLWIQIVLAV